MTLVRVYLPLTVQQCQALASERALPGPLEGYAVTESVRSSDPGGDREAWEYAALQDAAQGCVQQGGPVVVAAVDLDAAQLDDTAQSGSRIGVAGSVPLPRVAAFHVGDDVVSSAAAVHDPESEIELSWYDTTELSHLVSLI